MATPTDSGHESLAEQLPLLAGGSLPREEEARLRAHVTGCRACEEELAALTAVRELTAAQYARFALRSPQPSMARVLARVDADRREAALHGPVRQRWQSRIVQWWDGWPSGARWLAATQAATLAALTVLILIAWPARETTVYESASAPAAAATTGRITVAFADAARAVDIATLLADVDATIVDGPTAAGFYTLRLTPRSPPDALARLRTRADLVRYAEVTSAPK